MKKIAIVILLIVVCAVSVKAQINELKFTSYGVVIDQSGVVILPGISKAKLNDMLTEFGWRETHSNDINTLIWKKGKMTLNIQMQYIDYEAKVRPLVWSTNERFIYSVWYKVADEKLGDIQDAIRKAKEKNIEISNERLLDVPGVPIGFHVHKKMWRK